MGERVDLTWPRSIPSSALLWAMLAGAVGCGGSGPPAAEAPRPRASATPSAPPTATTGGIDPSQGPLRLRFLGNVDFPPRTAADGRAFGGISALAYRPSTHTLFALSDAHEKTGPLRIYELKVDLEAFDVRMKHRFGLSPGDREMAFDPNRYDPEGLALSPLGELVITSEGDQQVEPREGPRFDAYQRTGHGFTLLKQVPLPTWVAPTPEGPLERGMRGNKGPEALTAAPSFIFVGFEQALVQDGEVATPEAGTDVRLLRYGLDLTLQGAHHYRTDPSPPGDRSSLGLTELAALDDDHLLALERGTFHDGEGYRNRVRIYLVDLSTAANVLERPSLRDHQPVPKTLLLDLGTIAHRLFPTHALDNFEALALVRDDRGRPTHLIVASDDNFSSHQRTCFILFAIEGTPTGAPMEEMEED